MVSCGGTYRPPGSLSASTTASGSPDGPTTPPCPRPCTCAALATFPSVFMTMIRPTWCRMPGVVGLVLTAFVALCAGFHMPWPTVRLGPCTRNRCTCAWDGHGRWFEAQAPPAHHPSSQAPLLGSCRRWWWSWWCWGAVEHPHHVGREVLLMVDGDLSPPAHPFRPAPFHQV
jgi:hypothetical protein